MNWFSRLLPRRWRVKYHKKNKLPPGWAIETDGKNWRFITNDGYKSDVYSTQLQARQVAKYVAKDMEDRSQRLNSIWVKVDNND